MFIPILFILPVLSTLSSPIYAIPLSPFTSNPPSPLVRRNMITCFEGSLPSATTHIVSPTDCYRIIRNSFYGCANPSASHTFSYNTHSATYTLPKLWTGGDCSIMLDMENIYRNMVDSTSLAQVGTRALAVIRQCVLNGGSGGYADLGDRERLLVGVSGRWREESRTPAAMNAMALALQMETACASGLHKK